MRKLLNDTLRNKDGIYDRQALTFFISAGITFVTGIALVISSYGLNITNNPTAENVFVTFAGLTAALSGVDIWKRKVSRKTNRLEEENT